MSAGDVIAIYAAVVSTATGLIFWLTWRRAPEARIEVRRIEAEPSAEGWALSAIAVNRSPYEVVLTEARFRCNPRAFRSVTRTEYPDGSVADTTVQSSAWGSETVVRATGRDGVAHETVSTMDTSASIQFFGLGISVGIGSGSTKAKVELTVGLEGNMIPAGMAFPASIKPGQGQLLEGLLPMNDALRVFAGDIRVETTTNDGRAFTAQATFSPPTQHLLGIAAP